MVFGSRSEKKRDKATKLLKTVEKKLTALQAEMDVVLGPDPDPKVPVYCNSLPAVNHFLLTCRGKPAALFLKKLAVRNVVVR